MDSHNFQEFHGVLRKSQEMSYEDVFPIFQIINAEGQVINHDYNEYINDELLLGLMKRMVFARVFDEQTRSYSQQARMGFYAPTQGQEAAQIASHMAFDRNDWLYGSYRDIPQLIMHGASVSDVYLWSKGHVQGSQFAFNKDVKAAIPQIIIGAQFVQAQGNALGQKLKGDQQVTFTYIGDGGTSQGDTYEAMNFAGRFKSPIVFFFINNGYAISTPIELQTQAETFAQKAVAAGLPSVRVDGNDPLATYFAALEARNYAVSGKGPVVIELITNRMQPHSTMGDDPLRYRDEASLEYWAKLDPIARFNLFLRDRGLWSEEEDSACREKALAEIKAGMEAAEAVAAMSLADSYHWQYDQLEPHLQEQLDQYLAKGAKQ